MKLWKDERMKGWLDDWMIEWLGDRMIWWYDDMMMGWYDDGMIWWWDDRIGWMIEWLIKDDWSLIIEWMEWMIRKDDINCICIRVKERQMENILLLLIWMVFINIASGMTQLGIFLVYDFWTWVLQEVS